MFLKGIAVSALVIPVLCFSDDIQVYKESTPTYKDAMPITNWTGFYIGGNLGWKGAEYDVDTKVANFIFDGSLVRTKTVDLDLDDNSATGGIQAGFNYQIQQFLVGIEVDWNGMDLDEDRTIGDHFASEPYVAGDSFSTDSRWEASVRARLGYVCNNWLFYATGGAAFINVNATANFIESVSGDTTFPASSGSDSQTFVGWTAGLGAAYALSDHWSVGLEYRYSSYNGEDDDFDLGSVATFATSQNTFHFVPVTAEIDSIHTNEVLAKINFRFG